MVQRLARWTSLVLIGECIFVEKVEWVGDYGLRLKKKGGFKSNMFWRGRCS